MSNHVSEKARFMTYMSHLDQAPTIQYTVTDTILRLESEQGHAMVNAQKLYLMVFVPAIIGFADWILQKSVSARKNRIYFLSRDGYQIYLAARSLSVLRGYDVECRYLHVSRYSMRLPAFHMDIEHSIDSICVGGIDVTLRRILKRGGLSEEECQAVACELRMEDCQDRILNSNQVMQLKECLKKSNTLKSYIGRHSAETYENAIGYLKQEGLCDDDRYYLADSGWIGTLQQFIDRMVHSVNSDIHVEGCYFGMYEIPDGMNPSMFHTYYFSHSKGLGRKAEFSNSLFETVVSSCEGMTYAYVREGERYVPVSKTPENPNAEQMEQNIEVLASFLTILEDRCSIGMPERLIDQSVIRRLFQDFMSKPSMCEVEAYGDNPFSDDVTDENYKRVAEELSAEQMRHQHFVNKLLIVKGIKKATIRESAWIEGSAVRLFRTSKRRIRRELRCIRRYKYLMFGRKQFRKNR